MMIIYCLLSIFSVFVLIGSIQSYIDVTTMCNTLEETLPITNQPLPIEYVHCYDMACKFEPFFPPNVTILLWNDHMIKQYIEEYHKDLLEIMHFPDLFKLGQQIILLDYGGIFFANNIKINHPFYNRLPHDKVTLLPRNQDEYYYSIIASPKLSRKQFKTIKLPDIAFGSYIYQTNPCKMTSRFYPNSNIVLQLGIFVIVTYIIICFIIIINDANNNYK